MIKYICTTPPGANRDGAINLTSYNRQAGLVQKVFEAGKGPHVFPINLPGKQAYPHFSSGSW